MHHSSRIFFLKNLAFFKNHEKNHSTMKMKENKMIMNRIVMWKWYMSWESLQVLDTCVSNRNICLTIMNSLQSFINVWFMRFLCYMSKIFILLYLFFVHLSTAHPRIFIRQWKKWHVEVLTGSKPLMNE